MFNGTSFIYYISYDILLNCLNLLIGTTFMLYLYLVFKLIFSLNVCILILLGSLETSFISIIKT